MHQRDATGRYDGKCNDSKWPARRLPLAAPVELFSTVALLFAITWSQPFSFQPLRDTTEAISSIAAFRDSLKPDLPKPDSGILLVDEESALKGAANGLGEIEIVTPTPVVVDRPSPQVDSSTLQMPRRQQEPSAQSGMVRVGKQLPVRNLTPEATVDPAIINDLIAPLLQDQIQPTPLVIDLEVPTNGSADATGPKSLQLTVPDRSSAFPHVMLIPTPTPVRPAYDEAAAQANLPKLEIVPAVGVRYTPTPTPVPTATPVPEPTALWQDNGPMVGRLWSTFQPRAPENNDHFWLRNPLPNYAANNMASPNYQFGSTAGGRYRPHHGVDISNPTGTPVMAGAAGEVVFAGPDDPVAIGPYPDFYGNAVVIRLDRRLPVAGGRLDVYVLYGHLSEVRAQVGQRVQPEDIIGLIGMEGIAIGPHLHVEIRLGSNTYSHNVNPYLWMEPQAGTGAVAVRLLSADGRTWSGAKLSLARFEGGRAVWARQIETYLDVENIGPDPAWGENGAMGDVPAGYYYLIGKVNGQSIRAELEVKSGQTTFVEVITD